MITKVKRLHSSAVLPRYGYSGDAGMDLSVVGEHRLNPGESRDLPTGIAVEMPPGLWGRITGRSSTLRKRGLFVNEGVIDEGYRGELLVYVTNRQGTPVVVEDGDRLAQLILAPVLQAPAEWADELAPSERGANGFGSTGLRTVEVPSVVPPGARPLRGPVYLGGSVDSDPGLNHAWRHHTADFPTYCPICACEGLRDPAEIVARNTLALDNARDALFMLDSFSVGTPIEAHHRIVRRGRGAVIVWPVGWRSVFIDWFASFPGVVVTRTLPDGWEALAARNAAVGEAYEEEGLTA